MAEVEAYDISDERIDLGSRVTLPKSWHARVSGEQDVPGTITVRVEWDAALGRTAVAFAALEREGEGVDITSQMLREVRTHWIMTRSALEVVTVDVGGEVPAIATASRCESFSAACWRRGARTVGVPVRRDRRLSRRDGDQLPPLKLVSDTLKISQSTATRLMTRARDAGLAPEVRIQEPRRAPAVDPYNDPSRPHYGPSRPGGPSIGL